MKIRYLMLALVGAMALTLGAVACSDDDDDDGGGGDEVTLADYFAEFAPLSQGYADDIDTLDAKAGEEFEGTESEEEAIEVFASFVDNMGSTTKAFVDDIDGLSVPEEADDAHSEAITAGRALVDMFDNARTVLESDSIETFDDATFVLDAPGFVAAQTAFGGACIGLQDLADANSIDIDMACPSLS